ncbi:MAG TPA: ABC transporter substrate-binding protein [Acidimicrobiia bacterium]
MTALVAVLGLCGALLVGATGGATAAAAVVARPEGAGPPVPASGIGTQAALDNPRCRHDDPKYGPYGRFDSTEIGGGPVCVKEWEAGADNGGATAPGVTKDRITVVAVIHNDEQLKSDPVPPKRVADNTTGRYQDAIYDSMLPQMRFYETWGRDVEVRFYRSSGDDEAAQRADLVAIKAMKPFAVIVFAQPRTGAVLESGIATAKIPVIGYFATSEQTIEQAPYRWNSGDTQAAAVNAAEVIGKQLVGKKAQYGGDDVKGHVRKFGVVYYGPSIDYHAFTDILAKYKGTITTAIDFTQSTDPNEIANAAATAVTKMKSQGVTTVVNITGAPGPLMEAADKQNWTPEWFHSGFAYADLAILARGYPVTQSRHYFGLSPIPAIVEPEVVTPPAVPYATETNPLTWYWGAGVGTDTSRVIGPVTWLLRGIHAAGPDLTPKTFKQGLFSYPPTGGALDNRADIALQGYGKEPKLPYDEYALTGLDFAPFWYDPDTTGPSNGPPINGKGVSWFPDNGKRYVATTWPTKPIKWFVKDGAIYHFTTPPGARLGYVGDCTSCPSHTGQGSPEAPSDTAVVFAAGGTGAAAA